MEVTTTNPKSLNADFFVQPSQEAINKLPFSETDLRKIARAYRYLSRAKALKLSFHLDYGTQTQRKESLINCFNRCKSDPENVIYRNGILNKIFSLSNEEFSILAKELCYQYQLSDPSFLNINSIRELPDTCKKELSALEMVLEKHPVLFFRVVEKCAIAHKKENIVSRCTVLLLSENTASQTIALETLGFSFEYRVLLRPFAKEISQLLLAMHMDYITKQNLLQESFAIPLIELLQKVKTVQAETTKIVNKKADLMSAENESEEEAESSDSTEISIFEQNILDFCSICENFEGNWDNLCEYRQRLIHLGSVILTLVKAKLESSKVDLELIKHNSDLIGKSNDSILFTAVTNIALAQKIVDCEKANNKALAEFHSAFETLQTFVKCFDETP